MAQASSPAVVGRRVGPADLAPGAPAFVSLRGIVKRFGRAVAVGGGEGDGVSVTAGDGEFLVLLGPSGCGKTTLLRMLAGLERPDEGSIWIGRRDVTRLPSAERRCGVVFQSYALFPNLSALGNVAFGVPRSVGRAERSRRAAAMLDQVGLREHADKYPSQLSGGQQQRVALARALAQDPALLLLDEPLSALDAEVRQTLRGLIREVQRRLGVTTVMVTHDQDEAMELADRVVVMNRGRVEQVGSPREVYDRPGSVFVASFLGGMNLLPAEMLGGSESAGETWGFRAELARVESPGSYGLSVHGRVRRVVFRGASSRVEVAVAEGRVISADAEAGAGFHEGQPVAVTAPRSAVHRFGADGGRRGLLGGGT